MLQTLLQKRSNGYYYFRWVCPPAIRKVLGKREIIKSLRTTSKIQALARAGSFYMAIDKLKEIYLSPPSERISLEAAYQLVDSLYEELYEKTIIPAFNTFLKLCELYSAKSFADSRKKQAELLRLIEAHRVAATNKLGEYEEGLSIFDRVKQILQKISQLPQDNLTIDYFNSVVAASDDMSTDALYSVAELAFYSLFASSADIFSDSDKWYSRYIYDLTQVFFRSYEIKSDKLDPSKATPSLPVLQSPIELKEIVAVQGSKALLFSALFEEFIDHKIANGLDAKQSKNYRTDFPIFLHFIGNKPIDQITRRDVKACLQACLKFPKRNINPYKGVPIAELAAMQVPESMRLAERSVMNFKKLLQGIFAYAKEQDYLTATPAADLKLGIKLAKKRTEFKVFEVVKLLNTALTNKLEWRKWFVLLAAYTGARRREIAQLRTIDFKVDEESGVKYMLITDEEGSLKTENALRRVPVHQTLIDLGLYEFLARSEFALFPSGADSAMTRHFPLIMRDAGIEKVNELKQDRSLHSLRHSFITQTRGNNHSLDLVQAITGHERTSAGQTDVYTAEYTVDKLIPVINSLKYL